MFSSIASHIPRIPAGSNVVIAFEVLCKKKLANTLLGIIERFTKEDAKFIDSSTNWTSATKWVEWWMRPQHLKLLHKDYAEMDETIWNRCPSDTNAVERKNLDSKESLPQQLQIAMTNLYKYDKAACAKNIAAKQGVSVTYCDQSQEARKSEAAKRNMRRQKTSRSDLTSKYGPPDRECHFETSGKKRKGSGSKSGNAKRPKFVTVVPETTDEDSDFDDFTQSCFQQPKGSGSKNGNAKRPKIVSVVPETTDEDLDFDDSTHSSFLQPNPKYLGRKLQMRFKIEETGKYEWFNGQILQFDPKTGIFSLQMVRLYIISIHPRKAMILHSTSRYMNAGCEPFAITALCLLILIILSNQITFN